MPAAGCVTAVAGGAAGVAAPVGPPAATGGVVRPAGTPGVREVAGRSRIESLGIDVYAIGCGIADPRDRRGVRHSLASLFALMAAAMLADCGSWTRMMHWIAHADVGVLAAARCRVDALGRYVVPCKRTFDRVSEVVSVEAVERAVFRAVAARAGLATVCAPDGQGTGTGEPDGEPGGERRPLVLLAADGKVARNAVRRGRRGRGGRPGRGRAPKKVKRRPRAQQPPGKQGKYHLQVVLHGGGRGGGITIADRVIGPKTGESTNLLPLLEDLARRIDVRGMVITLDAGLSSRDNLRRIRALGMHYLILCKENHGDIYWNLLTVPFEDAGPAQRATTRDGGTRRREYRTITVLPAPAAIRADRPEVEQVMLLDRIRDTIDGVALPDRWVSRVGMTSLPAAAASPAELLAANRGHWSVEVQHWIRDVCFREDESQIWKGSRPHLMVTLRQLAHAILRLAGFTHIAAARREAATDVHLLLNLLGQPKLTQPTT